MRYLLFDIGGTSIKYALFEKGRIKEISEMPTRKTKKDNMILEDVENKIAEYKNISYIGISTAGVVDNVKGEIIFAGPTIPNYTGTKIKENIEKNFNIPCIVENDVNAASYGEYMHLKLKGSVIALTIGTGLGAGIILNGDIYRGSKNTAGEIGYIPFKNKHIQDYASTTYLLKYAKRLFKKEISSKDLFELAKNGDDLAKKALDKLITAVSDAILTSSYLINPDTVIIGGGITAQGKFLEDLILKKLKEKVISEDFLPRVRLAELENKAAIYGMYYLIEKNVKLKVSNK